MKIMAAATALNILKNEEKRYNMVKEDINDMITSCANHGEEGTGFYIGSLDDKYINRLLKDLKEAGYIIEDVKYMERTRKRVTNVYIVVSWAEV